MVFGAGKGRELNDRKGVIGWWEKQKKEKAHGVNRG